MTALGWAIAGCMAVTSMCHAQTNANSSIVVPVNGTLTVAGSSPVDIFGAGIVVASREDAIIVVTARHVVSLGIPATDSICVVLPVGTERRCVRARRIALPQDTSLDLAVLSVSVPAGSVRPFSNNTLRGRLGVPERLEFRHPLEVIGCPAGRCAQKNAEPQLFEGLTVDEIVFHTTSLESGNSGGALFNRWGEVVGMVITDGQARARAIRMDVIVDQLKDIGIETQLDAPSFPRAGYTSTLGAAMLAVGKAGHAPSARVTIERQLGTMLSWHVGGVRVAPANISLNAAVGGLSLDVRRGRITLSPFAEGAIGQVDAQYDAGGHFVDDGGTNRYVPSWHSLQGSAIGGGVGISAEAIVAPRLVIEGVFGKWRFSTPELSPALPRFTGGLGLRWSVNRR